MRNFDVGVLPLENLSVGCVTDVYDLLKEYNVQYYIKSSNTKGARYYEVIYLNEKMKRPRVL